MSPRKLTQLGRAVALPASPDKARLEAVPNPHVDVDYVVRFTAPSAAAVLLLQRRYQSRRRARHLRDDITQS